MPSGIYFRTKRCRENLSKAGKGRHKSSSTEFKKGHIAWNKGLFMSEEFKRKNSEVHKGIKHSEDTKRKISKANKGQIPWIKGKHHTKEAKRKLSKALTGRQVTDKTREKISKFQKGRIKSDAERKKLSCGVLKKWDDPEYQKKVSEGHKGIQAGEKHPNWEGGISKEPYAFEFDDELKESIKARDNYECQNPDCNGISKKLIIHHVNYDKKDFRSEHLITLCNSCNTKANFNRANWQCFYEEKLLCQ